MLGGSRKIAKFVIIMLSIGVFFSHGSPALADQYDDYIAAGTQHNIISNEHFLDINSMSAADIQSFLSARGSYLAGYSDGGRSAAQIIYDAAHGKYEAAGDWNGISINESTGTVNPEVILVFLQKEQSLISTSTYDAWKMTASMGYFCYAGVTGDDNDNNCKDIYEGFTKQVENGAWQLRYNYEAAARDATWWNTYYPGQTRYRVGDTITAGTSRTPPDSYQVTLTNQATASCYRYTPYVFFGNYNVWNLFYNTYDFDSTGGGNDSTNLDIKMYDGSVAIDGSKLLGQIAYFNDTAIAGTNTTSWNIVFEPPVGDNVYFIYYRDTNYNEMGYKRIHIIKHRAADINGDNGVNLLDLSILATYWGHTNPSESFADINRDCVVNLLDLSMIASNWTG